MTRALWLSLVGILIGLGSLMLCPAKAQAAASCTASAANRYVAYQGDATWAGLSSFAGCAMPSAMGSYAVCTAATQQPGSGGTTLTPWRQARDVSGRQLNWQLYDDARAKPLTEGGVEIGRITFTNPYFAATNLAYALHVPVNAMLVNGSYGSVVPVLLELRRGDCNGALEASFTLSVTVTFGVSSFCQILSTQPVSFGLGRSSTAQTVDAQGGITVRCYWGDFQVKLDDGAHALGGRRHVGNAAMPNALAYDIYTDPGRTQLWNQGRAVGATSNGQPITVPLYGRMPGQPTPPPGRYGDTVIATVIW